MNPLQVFGIARIAVLAIALLCSLLCHWLTWRYSVNVNNIFNREFADCNGASTCSRGAERTINGSVRYRW